MESVEDSVKPILMPLLQLSVAMRLMDIRTEDDLPDPDGTVVCYECNGSGNGCATCGDHLYMPRKEAIAHYIGAHGDNIMFPSKKKGETARAFNVLAEALTMLACMPGGVKFLGRHWEHKLVRITDRYAKKLRKVQEAFNGIRVR